MIKKKFIGEIHDFEGPLIDEDKYGNKAMLRKLIEEYPEILDPTKLEPTEDGRGFWILRDEPEDQDSTEEATGEVSG